MSSAKGFSRPMLSFYNSKDGGALLKRVASTSCADLGGLDLGERKIMPR